MLWLIAFPSWTGFEMPTSSAPEATACETAAPLVNVVSLDAKPALGKKTHVLRVVGFRVGVVRGGSDAHRERRLRLSERRHCAGGAER